MNQLISSVHSKSIAQTIQVRKKERNTSSTQNVMKLSAPPLLHTSTVLLAKLYLQMKCAPSTNDTSKKERRKMNGRMRQEEEERKE
jgi:hypothetical protein